MAVLAEVLVAAGPRAAPAGRPGQRRTAGLTDELLAWQTEALLALAVEREPWGVLVRPELVVEIAIDGVQTSPRYPGGIALRWPGYCATGPTRRPTRPTR